MEQAKQNFGDREMMDDMLASQKEIAGSYNQAASDCAHNALKSELMTILGEEHQIETELFTEMEKRGWQTVEAADEKKVCRAKDHFTGADS